jgi:hypothetical protein
MQTMLGTPYDWAAIVADGGADLHLDTAWLPVWNGTVPGHVVCSSLAAYAYGKAGLPGPAGGRQVQPADWDTFILTRAWDSGGKIPAGLAAPEGKGKGPPLARRGKRGASFACPGGGYRPSGRSRTASRPIL